MPDKKSREAILKIALRKWSLAKDVDLNFLAAILGDFSSADIVQICRKACASAVRELVENEQFNLTLNSTNEMRRDHFEKVFKSFSRCFPSLDVDTAKYEMFSRKWQSSYSSVVSFPTPDIAQNMNERGKKFQTIIFFP